MIPVRFLAIALLAFGLGVRSARAALWCTAYYPGWTQGYLNASNIDFSALTHVIHFSLVPTSTGGIDASQNVVTTGNTTSIIARAHAAGVKVLISVGGAGTQTGFQSAATSTYRATFISNLVQFTTSRGYDGVDVDWEPLVASDQSNFTNFIIGLRSALKATNANLLLTAATASQPSFFGAVQAQFDQINLMTYDMSGPWGGWITWFNSALYDGATRFPSTGGLVPSIDGTVTNFIAHGVPASKLGIGVPFYGYIWSGGAGTSTGGAALPRQGWTTAPTTVAQPYYYIITNLYQPANYRWDTNAQVPYLTLDATGSSNDKFVSYDNEASCRAKVRYAAARGLGGVMIWELSQNWRAEQPAGQRDPLLNAMKQELALGLAFTKTARSGTNVVLQFGSVPGRGYRLETKGAAQLTNWQLLTNVTATGSSTTVTDAIKVSSNRFYRVTLP